MKFDIDTLGIIRSPYKEKFAIPRQPGLVSAARARLELLPPYDQPDVLRGIEQFSHLWISFVFHQTMDQGWHPTVRPPRLGGNERVGVFATRSTFRPNPSASPWSNCTGWDVSAASSGSSWAPWTCSTAPPLSTSSPMSPMPTACPTPVAVSPPMPPPRRWR